MHLLANHFTREQVAYFAVNWREPKASVIDYLQEFGVQAPVLLDNAEDSEGCFKISDGSDGLYDHYQMRVGDPISEPPFPLQVVIDGQGRFAYLSRDHKPEAIIDVLNALIEK